LRKEEVIELRKVLWVLMKIRDLSDGGFSEKA
jgi:hypothetical protein